MFSENQLEEKKITNFALFLNNIRIGLKILLFNAHKTNLNWLFTLTHWSFGNSDPHSKKVRVKKVARRKKRSIWNVTGFIFK